MVKESLFEMLIKDHITEIMEVGTVSGGPWDSLTEVTGSPSLGLLHAQAKVKYQMAR